MEISSSPMSTNPAGNFCAKLNANNPGLYPPEYRKRAICLVGLGKAQSLEYPPAYRRLQTPFNNGLVAGVSVGFKASSLRSASLILARVSESTSRDVTSAGSSSRTDVTADSDGVGSYGSESTLITVSPLPTASSSVYRSSEEESEGDTSSTSSDINTTERVAAAPAKRPEGGMVKPDVEATTAARATSFIPGILDSRFYYSSDC
mmetsp:Transcript_32014/g.58967  ORF Transcript_32014/g.58967 Transcript_32014/m.58967 type:complete len:205 (-) Transcript_32014:56-670(-)